MINNKRTCTECYELSPIHCFEFLVFLIEDECIGWLVGTPVDTRVEELRQKPVRTRSRSAQEWRVRRDLELLSCVGELSGVKWARSHSVVGLSVTEFYGSEGWSIGDETCHQEVLETLWRIFDTKKRNSVDIHKLNNILDFIVVFKFRISPFETKKIAWKVF